MKAHFSNVLQRHFPRSDFYTAGQDYNHIVWLNEHTVEQSVLDDLRFPVAREACEKYLAAEASYLREQLPECKDMIDTCYTICQMLLHNTEDVYDVIDLMDEIALVGMLSM